MNVDVLISGEPDLFPGYAKPGDAGADLRAAENASIAPFSRLVIGTGVRIALPNGYVALVHPRSGLAAKSGITVLNTPGTVDSGYRGEILVTLFNSTSEVFNIERGDRIAQLVIQEFVHANFVAVLELPGSERGSDGFGSTGSK